MYLGGDADILEIFGFGGNSEIKGEDGRPTPHILLAYQLALTLI